MCKSLTTVVLVAVLASVGFFADAGSAHAQFFPCSTASLPSSGTTTCSGPATKYSVTLSAFKLRNSSDLDRTLVSSSQACDAAAVAANTEACQFGGSNLIIFADTYKGFVLEINRTFVASGTTTSPASCTATNASTTIDVPASGGGLTFEAFGSSSENLRIINTLSPAKTLAADITIDFKITLDAGAGVLYTFNSSGTCTGTAAGPLSMSLSFTCISGSCPSGP